ncbi:MULTISPECIES: plasmid mobilization relaxosome protein MobC [unclassified Enterococcus]|uniref:plasmid mobilization relaxosome protein MobC n=1 Tax=unclassified Enterococcus TaxID=2608891 RepID=UPI00197FA404|nr:MULTISPECIES: plasmid mobilization relaxosome protein MobC [unclassified Enterococcus]
MSKKIKRRRPIEKRIRFNSEEWNYLIKKIKRSPFNNFQNFARILLIQGEIRYVDFSDLRRLVSAVNRVGNNINQIARLANQFQEISQKDIESLTEEVSSLKRLVEETLKEEIKKERSV